MKRFISALLLSIAALPGNAQTIANPVVVPLLPLQFDHFNPPVPGKLGFFSAVEGPLPLSEPARESLENAVFWSWMTIGGFGASTLAFVITHGVDRAVGGVLSLVSVGYWTVSNLATTFTHRNISVEIKRNGSGERRPVSAGVAALTGGVLGAGAITAISLIFGDTSGAAEITAYVCFGLSAVAGGYGVFKTFEYASAAGTDLSFF